MLLQRDNVGKVSKFLLGIELISNDTYIKAYKFFQDFDIHGKNW